MAKAVVKKKAVKKKPVRAIRFKPDAGTIAELQFKLDSGRELSLYGLVLNESSTGCGLIVTGDFKPQEDTVCVARIGKLPRTISAVRWVKVLDKNVFKIGLEYDLL